MRDLSSMLTRICVQRNAQNLYFLYAAHICCEKQFTHNTMIMAYFIDITHPSGNEYLTNTAYNDIYQNASSSINFNQWENTAS